MCNERKTLAVVALMVAVGCAQGVPVGHDPDGRAEPSWPADDDVSLDLGSGHDLGSTACSMGAGAPCLLPGTLVSTSHDPGPLLLADVTGDSTVDVVVGNTVSDSVQVLSGYRWGGFEREQVLLLEGNVTGLAAADLDDDAFAEVIVLTDAADVVWVFRGGEAMDASAKGYELPGRPVAVAAGDLDADGLDELFVGLAGGAIGGLDIDAGATWDELLAGDSIVVDLAVAGAPASALALADGEGRAWVWRVYAPEITQLAQTGAMDIALGDVTGDGRIDAIVGSAVDAPWFVVADSSGFGPPRWLAGVAPIAAVASADLDGDAIADIVVGSDDRLRVFDGASVAPIADVSLRGPADRIATGDVDDDGHIDIVVVHETTRALELVLRER